MSIFGRFFTGFTQVVFFIRKNIVCFISHCDVVFESVIRLTASIMSVVSVSVQSEFATRNLDP